MDPEACREVLDVLKYIPSEQYDKISREYINELYRNAAEDGDFSYNAAVPFEEQSISPQAKVILSGIKARFWDAK